MLTWVFIIIILANIIGWLRTVERGKKESFELTIGVVLLIFFIMKIIEKQ